MTELGQDIHRVGMDGSAWRGGYRYAPRVGTFIAVLHTPRARMCGMPVSHTGGKAKRSMIGGEIDGLLTPESRQNPMSST